MSCCIGVLNCWFGVVLVFHLPILNVVGIVGGEVEWFRANFRSFVLFLNFECLLHWLYVLY